MASSGRQPADSGVEEREVEAREPLGGGGDALDHRLLVGHVADQRHIAVAVACLEVEHGDAAARLTEPANDRLADPPGPTGHQRRGALDRHGGRSQPPRSTSRIALRRLNRHPPGVRTNSSS